MFKGNIINSRTRCEICLKLTTCSSVSIFNYEQVNAGWVRVQEHDWGFSRLQNPKR